MGRTSLDATRVAHALRTSIGLFVRRMRQIQGTDELAAPEFSALRHLDRGGPTTPSALAKLEQISPQSMGATLAALEGRGLVERRPHPEDGRQVVMSLTRAGQQALRQRNTARNEQLARALTTSLTREEIEQLRAAAALIERLAERI